MKNNHLGMILLIISLIISVNLAVGQIKNTATIVLIKHDFQEDTFDKKEQKEAKKTFDLLSEKIDSTINVLKTDTTLGLNFVKKDAKNVNVIFSFLFFSTQKNKTRNYTVTMLLTDKHNNYKISIASSVIMPNQKNSAITDIIFFNGVMADVILLMSKELQFKALDNCFSDYFCQYTTPNLSSQKTSKRQYDSLIVITSLKLKAPDDILSKATSIIAKNALIRQQLKNEQNTNMPKNIYLTNHKLSTMSEGEIAVLIDLKAIRGKYILKVKLMKSKGKTIQPIEYQEVLEIDKKRFDSEDYTEMNYKINLAMADLCNNFFFKK